MSYDTRNDNTSSAFRTGYCIAMMQIYLNQNKSLFVVLSIMFVLLGVSCVIVLNHTSDIMSDSPTPDDSTSTVFDEVAYVAQQRVSLEVLYNDTGGPSSWPAGLQNSWFQLDNVCEWSNVVCYTNSQIIQTLNLFSVSLMGTIPTEIFQMTRLQTLIFGSNSLSGAIPSEIGTLSRLIELNLSHNSLTGQIPSEIGLLTRAEKITLSGNRLTGTIPHEFASLRKLTFFSYYQNSIDEVMSNNHVLCSLRNINGGNLVTLWADCNLCGSCCSEDCR